MERNDLNITKIMYGKLRHTTHATYHTTYTPLLTPDSAVNDLKLFSRDQEKEQVPGLATSIQCSTRRSS